MYSGSGEIAGPDLPVLRYRRMLPTLPVNQAFILWARCSTLDKADLANEALRLTAKGDIMQFATQEIDLLDPRAVDKLVSKSI